MIRINILVLLLASGCFTSSNNSSGTSNDSQQENTVSALQGELIINTSNALPLYKQVHSSCAVDIGFGKGMKERDVMKDPFYSQVKALNFNSLQFTGGSMSAHDHAIIGDTTIYGGKGHGYNIDQQEVENRGITIDQVGDGVGVINWSKDFFNEYTAFAKKLGVSSDIVANVQGGTLQELYWKIDRTKAKRVIFGMEQNLKSNEYYFPTAVSYKEKISKWMDAVKGKYPGMITVLDAAPIFGNKPRNMEWNQGLKMMNADEARIYFWDRDLFTATTDQNQNLQAINNCFSYTIPERVKLFQQLFPGKKLSIAQWGLKRDKEGMYNTMLACIYIARFYEWMIQYNNTTNNQIGYASYMSLRSLLPDDSEPSNHYYALKLCGMLFTGNKKVANASVGNSGVHIIACEEAGLYTVLIINETGSTQNFSSVKVNGNNLTGKNYQVTSISASSLGSQSLSIEEVEANSISLKPFSVSVIRF